MKFSAGFALGGVLPAFMAAETAHSRAALPDEIRGIKQRLVACYLRTADVAVPESANELAQRLRPDGTWPDLDVSAPPVPGQVAFRAFPHVHRLRKLAGAYRKERDAERRETIAGAIHRGLRFWLNETPAAPYAWFREIGAPTQLGQMALLCEDILTNEERAGVVQLMKVSIQPDGSLVYSGKPATGQNLIWEAHLQVVAGMLTNDADHIARYARRAEAEIKVTLNEGVQPDWSFHQHGVQLYSGGYGQDFTEDCARLVFALAGTRFAFARETVDTVLHYLLDGQQWMIRGRHWDYGPIGRWVAWPEGTRVASEWRAGFPGATGLANACRNLDALAGERRDELRTFAGRMEGRIAPEVGAPLGCRVFWRSEYVSCVRRGFFMAVRMSSRRAIGSETAASGQGLQNWHLGDGATCLMRSGGEYAEIGPVWNWRHLPGVTCIDTPDVSLPRNVWGRGAEGGSDFAGGVTDGVDAVAAMDLVRGGARAKKAWFFAGDAVVCLGAGIRSDSPGVPLVTGVEQCWARSPVQTSAGDSAALAGSAASLHGDSWVHHDGVTYLFGEDSEIRVRRERREAKWPVVNTFIHAPDPVSGDVFELWIDLGRPNESTHYHYVVAPGLSPAGIAAFQRDTWPRVLSNTVEVQAVAAHNVWQVVFWRPGAVELSAAWRLTADAPCLLQLRQERGGWAAAAGNPTHAVRVLRVRLEDRTTGRVSEASFAFPSNGFAGQPQVRTLRAA